MNKMTVKIGDTFANLRRDVLDAVEARQEGSTTEPVEIVGFQDWDTFVSTLSNKRIELLRHLKQHPAVTVQALANDLGRDYKRVHEDVAALTVAGFITREGRGVRAAVTRVESVLEF